MAHQAGAMRWFKAGVADQRQMTATLLVQPVSKARTQRGLPRNLSQGLCHVVESGSPHLKLNLLLFIVKAPR
jgi:hypothetical protein